MSRASLSQPACGDDQPHSFHEHSWVDHHFVEHRVWCKGVCLCGCTCPDHKNQPHGPGAHK